MDHPVNTSNGHGILSGPGARRTIIVANPGAGNDFTTLVPSLARWIVDSLSFDFVTSAAVANRLPGIIYTTNLVSIAASISANPIAASLARAICFSRGHGYEGFDVLQNTYHRCLPDMILTGGDTIDSITTNIQAADTFTNITLQIREWLEP